MEIEIHRVEDWEALYVDGRSVYQDHSGTFEEWLQRHATFPLTIKSMIWKYHEGDGVSDHAMDTGRLPLTLAELRAL